MTAMMTLIRLPGYSINFLISSMVGVLSFAEINTSVSSSTPLYAFLDTFNIQSDDPTATLTVNSFGNFTAYFRALPPAIPSEYWIPLYGIIISTIVGWSIPSIINWNKSKKQTTKLNSYHEEMNSLYDDGKLEESDTNRLNKLNNNVSDSLKRQDK